MNDKSNIFERIQAFSKKKGYRSLNQFAKEGLGYASSEKLNRLKDPTKKPSFDIIRDITNKFEDFDVRWFITGDLPQVKKTIVNKNKSTHDLKTNKKKKGVPFFSLPVSAGTLGEILANENESIEHVYFPGINPKAWFPVVGFSMKPTIDNGDIIAIDDIQSWDTLDPDKIYYIITHEDRMIKHLKCDPNDNEILICISPNFNEFKIMKSDIKEIYKVVFHGKFT